MTEALDFAYTIKNAVTMREVCETYGIRVNRMGKARCPFHHDSKPSMQIFDGNRGWWCYPCGEGGDVIDFVMRYFNLSFRDAIAKMNDDFHLGLPVGHVLDREKRYELIERVRKRQEARDRRDAVHGALLAVYAARYDRFAELDRWKFTFAPESPGGPFDERYVRACFELPRAQYLLDLAEMELIEFERRDK